MTATSKPSTDQAKQLNLRLLGPFEAAWPDAPIPAFATDKVRALLTYLALEGERPLRRETLATLLWPDWPDEVARRNLRQNLHRLKASLDSLDPSLGDRLLLADRQSVGVDGSLLAVDVLQFQATLAQVEAHPHRHLASCPVCLERLRQAAGLIRGEFLAGFSLPDAPLFDEWLMMQRERLHYQSVQTFFVLAEAHMRQADYEGAYTYALRQAALEPWREEAHRQIMQALAHQGARAEALAHYATCCRILDEELGVEPSEETTALYQAIVEERFAGQAGDDRPRLRHFPTYFTPFLGREGEIQQILDQLQQPDCRLLTLIAPGGMGKTRLAIAAANALAPAPAYPQGLIFVPLADTTDRAGLLTALAQAVEMPMKGVTDLQASLYRFVADQEMLLVLDNFEQILAEADVVAGLLRAGPNLQILVTAREALNLRAEWRFALRGLPCPPPLDPFNPHEPTGMDDETWTSYPGVQIFVQSARQVRPDFAPLTQRGAITRICQLVEGMPLALEMAGAWARLMTCQQIAEQISASLDILVAAPQDTPERQRSVRAIFEQTWSQLSPRQQRGLAELSIFRQSFSLEAALAITGVDLLILTQLVDRALIRHDQAGRYTMHLLLRQFGLEKLAAIRGAEAQSRREYAAYFLGQVADATQEFHQASAAGVISAMQLDLDNLRQAWQWATEQGDGERLAASAVGFSRLLRLLGLHQEGITRMGRAADQLAQQAESLPASYFLRFRQALIQMDLGLYHLALPQVEAVCAFWRQVGDEALLAQGLAEQGIGLWRVGQLAQADQQLRASLDLAETLGNGPVVAYARHHLANVLANLGDTETPHTLLNQSLAFYRGHGDLRRLAGLLNDMGATTYVRDLPQAQRYLTESLTIWRQLGDRLGATYPLHNLAYFALHNQEYDRAEQLLNEAERLARSIGFEDGLITCQYHLGLISLLARGDVAEAGQRLGESLRLAVGLSSWLSLGDILLGIALLHAQRGEMGHAVRLCAGIHTHISPVKPPGPLEERIYEEVLADARQALSPDNFAGHWAAGAALPLEELARWGMETIGA